MVVYFAFIMTRQVSFALIASRDIFLMAALVLVYAIQLNKKYGRVKVTKEHNTAFGFLLAMPFFIVPLIFRMRRIIFGK
jgi:hypothetical protein